MALDLSRWTVTVLDLPSLPRLKSVHPRGYFGALPVGVCESGGKGRLTLWRNGAPVELPVPESRYPVHVAAGRGGILTGHAEGGNSNAPCTALVWRADGAGEPRPEALPSKGWWRAEARAARGDVRVGFGVREKRGADRAMLWRGGEEPEALQTPEGEDSLAHATDGESHVGQLGKVQAAHAALWTQDGLVELTPRRDPTLSYALGVDGGEQVGALSEGGFFTVPVLWRGSAASRVELTPADHVGGEAHDCHAGLQVGHVNRRVYMHATDGVEPALSECFERAALWQGTASSFVDLHGVLPAEVITSWAREVRVEAGRVRVFGWGKRRAPKPQGEDARGALVSLVWESLV